MIGHEGWRPQWNVISGPALAIDGLFIAGVGVGTDRWRSAAG